jgi:CBS domain-containing protein
VRRRRDRTAAPALNAAPPAQEDIARFLRVHAPFDALDENTVGRIAAAVEAESYPAGATIFSQGADPIEYLRVVRRGAVEIVHHGRVLDLLAEGELFGQASMLSGLPTGFEARAAEATEAYRIPADVARELVDAPAGLRFVARSLLDTSATLAGLSVPARDPAHQPVSSLIRVGPVVCGPDTTLREAARAMTARGATSVVVRAPDGTLGILTDRDLRSRVIAAGLTGVEPVSAAMSSPAYTCAPDRLGGEVLLDMLDRGFRHFPVVTGSGDVLGVVEDSDLVAVDTRSSFYLRRRISRAQTVEDLIDAGAELRPMVIALHDARIAALNIMGIYSVVVDALTRRLLELAVARSESPAAAFAWLGLGSQARREALPSSDVDSAIVWFGDVPEAEIRPYLHQIGQTVSAGLERCGLRSDEHGATASNLLFVRSIDSWQRAARSWIEDPTQEKALLLTSVLVDSRPVWGVHTGTPVADTFRPAPESPALLRMLARFALSHRPPTGFFRGLVVLDDGEHRGRLDLKHGGMIPIVDLARWAGMAAGVTSASTPERLEAAGSSVRLSPEHVRTLQDAFALISELRLGHQIDQLRAGETPDDYVDPSTLSALTRSHLKEAFRAVAAIQKRVAGELTGAAR